MTRLREPEPAWVDGVPLCATDDCAQYDGKRCRLMGFRPDRICEPAVKDMSAELDRMKALKP